MIHRSKKSRKRQQAKAGALLAACVFGLAVTKAQAAAWISHVEARAADSKRQPVALQFRRDFDISTLPRKFMVRVSADNRYVLYVNGRRVAAGPSRGDLLHWRYRRLDLAPYLRRGRNVIGAQVWNDGSAAPMAQISAVTGFFFDAEDAAWDDLDSGGSWRVRVNHSRGVTSFAREAYLTVGLGKFYAAGGAEVHDAAKMVDWLGGSAEGSDWSAAVAAVAPGQAPPWTLVEDRLPPMRYERLPGGKLVKAEGVPLGTFPARQLTVPAHTTVTLLLDAGAMQAAYPELTVSGGRGSEIKVTYAEALYGPGKRYLADRAQVAGGQVLGLTDTFRPDGAPKRVFSPYWWRAWRFVQLRVTTTDQPLRLDRFVRYATGYPFQAPAKFVSSDPQLNRIWQIGWDTVRLDAHETFMDTAYWEQLQYVGDTRIEALITYAVSGDARLGEQAVDAYAHSAKDGLPRSRWPASGDQSIPPFALLWVGMLHDYWMWRSDAEPVRRNLSAMRDVLAWYARYVGPNGLVGTTPGWEFIDWRPALNNYPSTVDPAQTEQCVITLFYVGALQQASELERTLGDVNRADAYRDDASRLSRAINAQCWSAERGLYADRPEKAAFSQHANILAVLYDVAPLDRQKAILDRIMVRGRGIDPPEGVTGTTYYFAFYLAGALEHAGMAERYPELLQTWRGMLAKNFTTWPETPDPSRSDSHAWSAHPTLDMLTLIAGIEPAGPGFSSVRIAPHLGALTSLDAAMPHPAGLIATKYRRHGSRLEVTVMLPRGLAGTFSLGATTRTLQSGSNRFVVGL